MKHGLMGLVLVVGLALAGANAEAKATLRVDKILNLYQQVPELGPPTFVPLNPVRKPFPRWMILPWGFRYAL